MYHSFYFASVGWRKENIKYKLWEKDFKLRSFFILLSIRRDVKKFKLCLKMRRKIVDIMNVSSSVYVDGCRHVLTFKNYKKK